MAVTVDALSSVSVAAMEMVMLKNDRENANYTLVVGLGLTGLSVVRFLHQQNKNIVVVDSRTNPPGLQVMRAEFSEVSISLGEFDETLFVGAEEIIVSPGVALKEPALKKAVAQGVKVIGDIELFAKQVNAPVIAVTGSNGKSTVISLLGEMAQRAGIQSILAGNIGVPVLEIINTSAELYILELSSFQLETLMSLKPVSAAVLNITPDHMDRYSTVEDYAKTKQRIYDNCNVAVINRDDSRVSTMQIEQNVVSGFTLKVPKAGDFGMRRVNGENWLCKGNKKLMSETDVLMSGSHNIANALAALALGEAANLPMAVMLAALRTFSGLKHRTQWVAEKNNRTWVNDSKGTNVGATLAAITGLKVKNKLVLIAGGVAKDAEFTPLKNAICDNARAVVLMGKDAQQIENVLEKCVPVFYVENMSAAVKVAEQQSQAGDTVLLSPACASFDMFNGFEHRGDMFIDAVGELK